jgi:hypothetical protein
MERNVLKERLMNKDDKNRHFVLLIIDISKHGAKEMVHGKMWFSVECFITSSNRTKFVLQ